MDFFFAGKKPKAQTPANANAFGARAEAAATPAAAGAAGAAPAAAAGLAALEDNAGGAGAAQVDHLARAINLRRQMHTFLNERFRNHSNARASYADYMGSNPGKNAVNALLESPTLKHLVAVNKIHIPEEQKQLARLFKTEILKAKIQRGRGRTRRGRHRHRRRNQRKTRKL